MNEQFLNYPVTELVPHSPPMVLINRIVDTQPEGLTAEIDITEESLFFDNAMQGVPVWVGIEYMAQAIAALAGIRAKMEKQEIKLGFLLGTRKYKSLQQSFQSGRCFQIKVQQLYMDESGLASFDCSISSGDEIYAQARLNVFETDNADKVTGKS